MEKMIKSPFAFGAGCFDYTSKYFYETTFHGFRQIIMPRRHWFEMLLWVLTVISSFVGSLWIMHRSYVRYQANPVVISLYKNYRTWNVTFPASTLCFEDKFDMGKGVALIKLKWSADEESLNFQYYLRFLKAVANSSYHSFGAFEEFENDPELNRENLTLLMNQVSFEPEVISPTLYNKKIIYYNKTMLEMGICYAVNSLITLDLVPDFSEVPPENETEPWEHFYCLYLNLICYGVTEHLQRAPYYYVHSPFEIPEVNSKSFHVEHRGYRDTKLNHLDILSSNRIRPLKPIQRHCYFYDEPIYNHLKYYSFNLCKIQCRRELAIKLCKCVPHFYITQDNEPQCTVKQLKCIDQHKDELIDITEFKDGKTVRLCQNCYQACEEVNYYVDHEKITKAVDAEIPITKYHWSIENYSKTRYKRDIIFGIEDLLTSLGGTAGFFLGCSIMSMVELVYFFTLRLLRYCKSKPKMKIKKEQVIQGVGRFPPYNPHPPPTQYSHNWQTAKQYSIKIARQRRQALASYPNQIIY